MVEEEQYEKPKKKHTGLAVFLVLIAGVLIGAGGCYYYFEYMHKDTTKKEVKTEVKEEKEDEDLNVDSVLVKDLVARYDQYNTGTEEIYDNIYKTDINKVSDINDKTRLMIAYENTGIGLFNGFTSDELKTAYTKIFGKSETMKEEEFSYSCGNFKYDNVEKKYTYEPSAGCGDKSSASIVRKILDAKTKDNDLYINVAVGLKKAKDNNPSEFEISARDGVIEDIDANTFNIDRDYKKLDKIQYD